MWFISIPIVTLCVVVALVVRSRRITHNVPTPEIVKKFYTWAVQAETALQNSSEDKLPALQEELIIQLMAKGSSEEWARVWVRSRSKKQKAQHVSLEELREWGVKAKKIINATSDDKLPALREELVTQLMAMGSSEEWARAWVNVHIRRSETHTKEPDQRGES